ncbi:MAG TPA: ABC transporter permease [Gemmatimonadales bacterium]|nr:ABC transporter permease [Gemmatimonadales bacterium]
MGRALLIRGLVIGDIKRPPVQAALLLVMIVTTTTTLTLGLALRNLTDSPFARARTATRGPDVVAQIAPQSGTVARPATQFASLLHAGGVTAMSGPYPFALAKLTAPGIDILAQAEGRDRSPASLDQPALTAGHWIRPNQAVLESGFAASLGLRPGEAVHLNGHAFTVAGVAVSTAQCFYPVSKPGVIWLTRADAERVAARQQFGYVVNLKLARPASADDFAFGPVGNAFLNQQNNDLVPSLQTWLDTRHEDFRVIAVDQKALLIGGSLLALLALASIAVAVGGRMAEQTRRVGLLKAVGASPRLVAAILLAENLLLALVATAIGLAAGELLAPLLTDVGAGLLGSTPTPSLTAATAAEVAAVAILVAAAATAAPAIRGARTSTIRALADPARPPTRRARLIALSSRLPVPLLFALRLLARRPRRAALSAASLTIAVAMIVAALALQHRIDLQNPTNPGYLVGSGSVADRVSHLVYLLSAILVVLAAVNAVFTTWVTVIDAQRSTALSRALGATPRQVSAGMTASQLLPALIGACLGIPVGLALYDAGGGDLSRGAPPILWLVAVIPATLIVVAALTAIPARLGATRSPAEILRSD